MPSQPIQERVRPLGPADRVGSMRSTNGTGVTLKNRSAADADGRFFATRWASVLSMPLVPLNRLYLTRQGPRQTSAVGHGQNRSTRTTVDYQVLGMVAMRPGDILGTYLFHWVLCPAIILGPAAAVGTAVPALGAVWFFLSLILVAGFAGHRNRTGGPPRTPEGTQYQPPRAAGSSPRAETSRKIFGLLHDESADQALRHELAFALMNGADPCGAPVMALLLKYGVNLTELRSPAYLNWEQLNRLLQNAKMDGTLRAEVAAAMQTATAPDDPALVAVERKWGLVD
ncbi:hypothetical protein KGQ20_19370 [Catenulispora sp. NF23]|uniref:hypothetical protein n=1 Tax=Catenulispora pinistramenti TaxID=2705254 RepID=UPI001BAA721B|nr:hypothetical protein [Catenulispora pinistramenti]MBS2534934.1 hypothetical protein [Catenulispora pinistramenti]